MVKFRLEEVLKKKGISHRRFAKMIGMDNKNVARLFKHRYDPKLSTLAKFAKLLGVKISDLYLE